MSDSDKLYRITWPNGKVEDMTRSALRGRVLDLQNRVDRLYDFQHLNGMHYGRYRVALDRVTQAREALKQCSESGEIE